MRQPRLSRVVLALLLVTAVGLSAQETPEEGDGEEELFVPSYSLGDQTLAVNLGTFIPLFFAGGPDGVAPANLTLGGAGSLEWGSYITNEFKLGVEVGGSFSFTPNRRPLFLVPIAAKASYIFSAYPFEFPVSMGLGMSFARLDDLLKIDPFVKAGGSFFWNYSAKWAFGANLSYWFVPQIYTDRETDVATAGSQETRLGNFLELTLSALYHF
ncbi:MAG: TP0733 family outer membrane beta-barrel protein [Spirochaetota bacterium]